MAERPSIAFELGAAPGIKSVSELRDRLASEIGSRQSVTIDAGALESIDVSALQLLASAHRSAAAAGKTLLLLAPVDGVLAQTLVRLGFISADGAPLAPEGDFWLGKAAEEGKAA